LGGQAKSNSTRKIDPIAALLWLGGIASYHAIANFAPQWGAALPTLALTFTLAWLSRSKT
jgi:hypothetical protein